MNEIIARRSIEQGLMLDVSLEGPGARIEIAGDIDAFTVKRLRDAIDTAFEGRPAVLYLDCSEVRFFGAEGARALLHAAERARREDSVLRVVASRPVRRSLEVFGLGWLAD